MTPADRAMKSALDEGVRYSNSPPAMAPSRAPLLGGQPDHNLTSFERRSRNSSDSVGPSLNIPVTPHISLHQFRKLEHSSAPSSSPDLDYKRVRRKPSFSHLVRLPFVPARLPVQSTSSPPSLHSTSTSNFLPALLPPLPWTPVPRPSTTSPSLSSTVDTLQSTPTHTPVHRGSSPFEQWRSIERVELSEPIRSKRKFSQLKLAKRLPHYTAQSESGGDIWEVHAAVIEVGEFDFGTLETGGHQGRAHMTGAELGLGKGVGQADDKVPSSGRKGRLVRFEGLEPEESSSGTEEAKVSEPPRPDQEKDSSLSSSFSLSKFNFPAPPRNLWRGTFGHLTNATPATSPATLDYEGASFDVVNPHNSLLLGVSDFETPAEIDGLLDDYFHSRDSLAMAYNDPTGEKSTSQHSLQTSSSNGRQRVLFNDPESARRNIMRIQPSSSQQTVISPRFDTPFEHGTQEPETLVTEFEQPRPATPVPFVTRADNRSLQIHPNLRAALGTDAQDSPYEDEDPYELNELPMDCRSLSAEENIEEAHGIATLTAPSPGLRGNDLTKAVDRGSSLYPHSQRSNPFDLSISDVGDDQGFKNIDGVVATTRSSYYAGDGALYDKEEDFNMYEDAPDANVTQSHDTDTTVGNIVGYYNYARTPTAQRDDLTGPGNIFAPSPSLEFGRVRNFGYNPFQAPEGSEYNTETGTFEDPRLASRMESPPIFDLHGRRLPSRTSRPPTMPVPTPTIAARQTTAPRGYISIFDDSPTTEQTYGNTDQLLRLTPRTGNWPIQGPSRVPVMPLIHNRDDDKVNTTPPHDSRPDAASTMSVTPTYQPTRSEVNVHVRGPVTLNNNPAALVMPRSSNHYPDDDSIWEDTQASGSRVNLAQTDDRSEYEAGSDYEARPSQESYADTSDRASNPRLSLPRGAEIGMPTSSSRYEQSSEQVSSRPRNPGPDSDHLNWTADENRALQILKDKYSEDTFVGGVRSGADRRDPARYTADMKELERLRNENPAAVEKAVTAVTGHFDSISHIKPAYSPAGSFMKAAQMGRGRNTYDSAYSETQGLLDARSASPDTSGGHGGLRFSETANTFQTARRMPSMAMGTPVKEYSPLNPALVTPPMNVLIRDYAGNTSTRISSTKSLSKTPAAEEIEMQPLSKKKHVSRRAMSSQTELRPLELVETTGRSGFSGRFTDAQMVEAEPGWTTRPDFSHNGPLARLSRRNSGPTSFLIRQPDGRLERGGMLLRPTEARNLRTRSLQKELTRTYFRLCILFPVIAALFGLGHLDWMIKEKSEGFVEEMSPEMKKTALITYLPLGLIIYTAVALMVTMIVLVTK